ncbi:hypothetical protein BS78_02G273000 [Paspalum vaginatum]|nr:hypothetical protein BS78_02G273000 [Paspalum vaginatum]
MVTRAAMVVRAARGLDTNGGAAGWRRLARREEAARSSPANGWEPRSARTFLRSSSVLRISFPVPRRPRHYPGARRSSSFPHRRRPFSTEPWRRRRMCARLTVSFPHGAAPPPSLPGSGPSPPREHTSSAVARPCSRALLQLRACVTSVRRPCGWTRIWGLDRQITAARPAASARRPPSSSSAWRKVILADVQGNVGRDVAAELRVMVPRGTGCAASSARGAPACSPPPYSLSKAILWFGWCGFRGRRGISKFRSKFAGVS